MLCLLKMTPNLKRLCESSILTPLTYRAIYGVVQTCILQKPALAKNVFTAIIFLINSLYSWLKPIKA